MKIVGNWCGVRGAGCVVRGAWCVVLGAWCVVLGAGCLVLGAWCLVLGAWCLVLGAWFAASQEPGLAPIGSQNAKPGLGPIGSGGKTEFVLSFWCEKQLSIWPKGIEKTAKEGFYHESDESYE
jgi:hypothetical protein